MRSRLIVGLSALALTFALPLGRAVAAGAAPVADDKSGGYAPMDLADLKVDKDQLVGRKVETKGQFTMMGDIGLLADGAFDTTPVFVTVDRLPRDQRKRVNDCGAALGCSLTIRATVGRTALGVGLRAENVE